MNQESRIKNGSLYNKFLQPSPALMNARKQRSKNRGVHGKYFEAVLELLTQQAQRAVAELLASPGSRQLWQEEV